MKLTKRTWAWITGPNLMWMIVKRWSCFVNIGLDSLGQLIYFVIWGFCLFVGFFSLKYSFIHFNQRVTPTSQRDSLLPCQEVLRFSCRSLTDMNIVQCFRHTSGMNSDTKEVTLHQFGSAPFTMSRDWKLSLGGQQGKLDIQSWWR